MFPASSPLEPVYRSMTVWNDGDTPALFEMSPDPNKYANCRTTCVYIPVLCMFVSCPCGVESLPSDHSLG